MEKKKKLGLSSSSSSSSSETLKDKGGEDLAKKVVVVGGSYNGLIVEEYLGIINKRRYWKVRCSCGKIKDPMRCDSLRKSKGVCTCSRGKMGYVDLSGKVFNKLTVLTFSEAKINHTFWKVRCVCGKEYISRSDVLKINKDGCGCHIRPHRILNKNKVEVDVSTKLHKNIFTIVDTHTWNTYMQSGSWWAIYSNDTKGYYVQGMYKKRQVMLHQLVSGSLFIDKEITDHISGDTLDNRSLNLRSVSPYTNNLNRSIDSRNTSGHTGVSLLGNSKYRSYITKDGKQVSLGTFSKLKDAITARKVAEARYGFHKNHGRSK